MHIREDSIQKAYLISFKEVNSKLVMRKVQDALESYLSTVLRDVLIIIMEDLELFALMLYADVRSHIFSIQKILFFFLS